MDFHGPRVRLDDYDLPRIGRRIGVGEDELHALIEVETAGGPSDKHGRLKMLFEPHRFYAELGPGEKRARAVREGLAYARWGTKPYPADSYPRLLAAIEIDTRAALESASWGLGQIMGSNYRAAGYPSVHTMVEAFCADEAQHLEAMVNFLVYNGLDDELREHRWAALARGYNGPGYAKHGYDKRLEAAYRKWARIRDTPYVPGAGVTSKPLSPLAEGSSRKGGQMGPSDIRDRPAPPPAFRPAERRPAPQAVIPVTKTPKPSGPGFWARFWASLSRTNGA